MITIFVIRDADKKTPYLSTISKERADEWLEIANEGGCRSMGWKAKEYELFVKQKPSRERTGLWEF